LLRVFLTRLIIFAAPFIAFYIWREIARRSGREMGSTPWTWLAAAGAIFVALSLMSGAFWYRGHRPHATYGPEGALPDGRPAPAESVK
jgi:hypothetical protein